MDIDAVDKTMTLLVTISGGLEELAIKQVQRYLQEILLDLKCHRRSSGSQLYIVVRMHEDHDDSVLAANLLADAISKFDFVEYVSVLLHSFHIISDNRSNDGILNMLVCIEEGVSKVSKRSIDICTHLCDTVNDFCSRNDIGLEGLPGMLLPTPKVSVSSSKNSVHVQTFEVNTIYTYHYVALSVLQTIKEFIGKFEPQNMSDTTLWIDAGAGNGTFLEHLPKGTSVGFDIHPTSSLVYQMDFLKLSKEWLIQHYPNHENLFIVSNPPFSLLNRGDYTPIVKFINHSFDYLNADFIAIICPNKFVRQRIWKSYGLTEKANLWGRFLLPQNSFYDPSSGKTVHIDSSCLIFSIKAFIGDDKVHTQSEFKTGVYISSKRDKGLYPKLTTAELTSTIASGLTQAGLELRAERNARYMLQAKLENSSLNLWWQINHQRPCSLMNCNSSLVSNHSVGWISLSVKPAVALAMSSTALDDEKENGILVNLMSGEGTIELESSKATNSSFFMISGDKSSEYALKTLKRLETLRVESDCNLLIDLVVWDAQNLPLRTGIADAIVGDLPFQGSLRKQHLQPVMGEGDTNPVYSMSPSLKYDLVLGEACRILRSKGRAVLVSADSKALIDSSKKFNWTQSNNNASLNINLGGLIGKLLLMERKDACTKDLCISVPCTVYCDYSSWILHLANKVCEDTTRLITQVTLLNTFLHPQKLFLRHCYRLTFHDQVRNIEAKSIEQQIR